MTRPPQSSPRPPKVDDRDPDETLESLVADVFGGKVRQPNPDETVMVPPEPRPKPPPSAARPAAPPVPPPAAQRAPSPAPPPSRAPDPPTASPEPGRRRRSLFQRLQVSPAVIVASIIAGATGAAADAWFDDIATFFSELTSDTEGAAVMPHGIAPSTFPEEGEEAPPPEAAEPADPTGTGVPPDPEPAPGAAEESAPADVAATPADRIRVITWDESVAGTVVTFWGNGALLPERIVRFRIPGDRPRELVKLRGIDVPFPDTVLDAGTPEVIRVRTGFHPQDRINELHVVLDLSGPEVVVDRVETGPQSLRVHLSRGTPAGPAE